MLDRLFGKRKTPEENASRLLSRIKLAVVNQAYAISDDFFIRAIAHGLFALVVIDERQQVRSLSKTKFSVQEQEIFNAALNNTFNMGVDDRNELVTISNGDRSIEVIQIANSDYFLSSFVLTENFFHHLQKSPDVLFSCPSRDRLLVFPLEKRTETNASDVVLFGQFSFEMYLQGEKKIRPDIYYWNDGAYGCLMKYDHEGHMQEFDNRLLERICK